MVSLRLLCDPKCKGCKISDKWKDSPYPPKIFFCSHGVFVSGKLLPGPIPCPLQLLFLVFGGVQRSRVDHIPGEQHPHGQAQDREQWGIRLTQVVCKLS